MSPPFTDSRIVLRCTSVMVSNFICFVRFSTKFRGRMFLSPNSANRVGSSSTETFWLLFSATAFTWAENRNWPEWNSDFDVDDGPDIDE